MNADCPSKAQQLCSSRISTLPQTLIENILCLLTIQEAARTSILSREWRYRWTTIPKLKFWWSTVPERTTEENQLSDISAARKNMDKRCKLFNAIHQVLLMRQGPIHEFTYYSNTESDCFELDPIIFHLSRNHAVKKLKLTFDYDHCYKLPLCAFSLHQLTDLDLSFVDLDYHQPTFNGFGSLRNLSLFYVDISTKSLLHLLSNCPSLKMFSLLGFIGSENHTIIELFECLPMIEHLTIYEDNDNQWLVLDSVPKELPTTLIHLKYFCFVKMSLDDGHHLTFLVVLIKCSPNLEKIELEIEIDSEDENGICSSILEEYSDIWLEHLKELKIAYFNNTKPSMGFVKFILARSPKLKKVWLGSIVVEKDEEVEMLKALLQTPRASPVEIVVG